jgi:hypothetical protein
MYAMARENGHIIWKKQWYALMSRVLFQADLYMTQEDQVFVVNAVVTNLMRGTIASNLIS